MAELIQTYLDIAGGNYNAHVMGEEREDGTWEGWIEFGGWAGDERRTGRETTQPSREALAYWASGLEPVYLEGALTRASRKVSEE